MRSDLVPLVAGWIIWEMFFENAEFTDRQREDRDCEPPPDVSALSPSR